jgi:hypothetical protein
MIRSKLSSNGRNRTHARSAFRLAAISAAVISAFAVPNVATAFEIDVGNPDLQMRWDNTIRYNLGLRTTPQDPAFLNNLNLDDGDRNFKKNSLVANRLDVLSEFDLVWARSFGGRVSLAGWYDFAYRSLDNTSPQTANTLSNGLPVAELSGYTKRYARGASGEVLDAFGFANFDVATMPVNVKAGQYTVFWGDSLLGNGAVHSVSYSQNPIDQWKAVATPGAEAKELFRPRQGATIQIQPTNDLSIAGQYFWAWQAYRFAESGSYLTFSDAIQFGADSAYTAPGQRLWHNGDITPKDSGDWGVSARWSPEWLDGTVGFYYRRSSDAQLGGGALVATLAAAPLPASLCTALKFQPLGPATCYINPAAASLADLAGKGKVGTYNLAYGTDINIYGVSLSKNLGGISFGSEVSYRENMPLLSSNVLVLPQSLITASKGIPSLAAAFAGAISTTDVPEHGFPGARGNTWHGLVNALGVLPKTPLFDTLSYSGELTWMMWDKVTNNPDAFKGREGYNLIDRVSKSYFGLAINLTPTWFQVVPGVDLLMPLSWQQGLAGNSAVTGGGQDGTGSFSFGLAADIYSKYRIDLKYVGFFGNYQTCSVPTAACAAPGGVLQTNGTLAGLTDRGFINLTFKTTF